jgi:RNA polymerase sigma-70 factor (ECF subfamily)
MVDEELSIFCRAEYPRLVGLLGLYCGDRGVAEELAQETLARVWRKWPKVHHLDRPDAWARRVAINLANSHLRRVVAERRARNRLPVPNEVIEPVTDEALALRESLVALPRRQRTAVVLHYYVDLTIEEVAEHMGTTIPSVKSLLHRGVKRLRAERGFLERAEVPDAG